MAQYRDALSPVATHTAPEPFEATIAPSVTVALSCAVDHLAEVLVDPASSDRARHTIVEDLVGQGWSAEHMVEHLFIPTARLLGDYWLEDRASFVDVTIATHRLTLLLFELERVRPHAAHQHGGRMLLACAPGDQHGFGLQVLGFQLRGAGWIVDEGANDARALAARVAANHYDVLGISVGHDRAFDAVSEMVRLSRNASRNRALVVALGGPALLADHDAAWSLGGDFVAKDGAALIARIERLRPRGRVSGEPGVRASACGR